MTHRIRNKSTARGLAREYLNKGDPLGWFEKLYAEANQDASIVPWANLEPNPLLTSWASSKKPSGKGRCALTVGCGLGDDAEFLTKMGFRVTAFDISPRAIDWCRSRFPGSSVNYHVANLFDSPENWLGAFDFVLEVYTLQALPMDLRKKAVEVIARFVASDGTLLLITHGRDDGDDLDVIPWPLTREEIDAFNQYDLAQVSFEDITDAQDPPVRRFAVEYRKRNNVSPT